MNDLEQFIKDNRDDFDQAFPPSGHESRFAEKLSDQDSPKRVTPAWWLAIAATVSLLVCINVGQYFLGSQGAAVAQLEATPTYVNLADKQVPLAEVSQHFEQQLDVMQASTIDAGSERDALLVTHLKRLEDEYAQLNTALIQRPGDQRIVKQMIINYRMRIALLEKHLQQIHSTNNQIKRHDNV